MSSCRPPLTRRARVASGGPGEGPLAPHCRGLPPAAVAVVRGSRGTGPAPVLSDAYNVHQEEQEECGGTAACHSVVLVLITT